MRSFKEYLKERYYNLFYDAIREFIGENKNNLSFRKNYVSYVDRITVDDISIVTVHIRDEAGLRIGFDVIIETELELYDYRNKRERIENVSQWFSCSCFGSLEDNLASIEIVNVEEYSGKRFSNHSLTDQFVPVVCHEDLDGIATEFLKKYYPKALLEPLPIDAYMLAETMNLSIIERTITTEGTIFGQLFFRDAKQSFYDDNGETIIETVPADTIVLDPAIFFLRDIGTINHTIVHECVHKEYHYKKFLFESIYDIERVSTRCGTAGDAEYSSSNESYLEWQANALASHILMPELPFKKRALELLKKYGEERGEYNLIDVLPAVIDQLADFFGVSRIAAKIRLVECGYEDAIGVYDYIYYKEKPNGNVNYNPIFFLQAIRCLWLDWI